MLALHWVSFFAAIQVSTVAVGLLGFASFPLFTLLIERVFLARRIHRREAITALLVTAGLGAARAGALSGEPNRPGSRRGDSFRD